MAKGHTNFIFSADVFAEVPPFPGSISAMLIVITTPCSSLVGELSQLACDFAPAVLAETRQRALDSKHLQTQPVVDIWMLNQTAVAFQAHSLGEAEGREVEKCLYAQMP